MIGPTVALLLLLPSLGQHGISTDPKQNYVHHAHQVESILDAGDANGDGSFSREEARYMLLQQQELWLLCCSAVEEEEDSCIDGWVGELCDQCAPGHNGPDCTPDQVADEEPCALGWQGEDSDQCAPGHSGEGCARDTPPQVKQLCELGLHDHDRDAQTPCELCPASTYRDMTSGPHDCVPCPDGLVSTPGSPSSAYCVSSHPHTADRTAAAKAKATSVIPVRDAGCLPGWQGEDCDKCALGHSGEDCTTDTLPSPADPPAAEEAGCLPGWQGEDCDHCGPGHSGDDCTPISAAGPKKPAEGTVAKFPNSSPVTRAGPPPPWDEYGYIITHYCQGRCGTHTRAHTCSLGALARAFGKLFSSHGLNSPLGRSWCNISSSVEDFMNERTRQRVSVC
jgi:hypothetical protein